MRCYAPSTSAIVAFVFIGYLALRDGTGHALAAVGLVTTIIIALGVAGVIAGAVMVSAATIRARRAAAGAATSVRLVRPVADKDDCTCGTPRPRLSGP